MKKVTKAHFRYFCARIQHWLVLFGATDWTVFFEQNSDNEFAACVRYNYLNRSATFILPIKRTTSLARKTLNHDAIHETIHVVLAPLADLAERRFTTQDELDSVVEGITCQLTHAIVELIE